MLGYTSYHLHTALTALLLLPFRVSWAEDIDFNWRITTYQPQTAKVGDTITFNWSGSHNVYIHPSGTCDESGSIEVGTSTGSSYTFTSDDVGEVVFACDVGSHCENDQIVTFNVVAADTPSPTSNPTKGPTASPTASPTKAPTSSPTPAPTKGPTASPTASPTKAPTSSPTPAPTKGPTASPTASPTKPPTPAPTMKPTAAPTKPPIEIEWFVKQYEPRTANVGDTIVFKWGNDHNVFIHPTGTCDSTGSIEVGSETGTTYTFTEDDVGDVTFACDVSFHCENGQILTFTVYPEDVDAPTMSPATSAGEILKTSGQIVSLIVSTLILSFQLI